MQTLALLRPRSVIPHVIKSIEEGYSAPPVPLRHIKSLKVLASCSSSFCCPNVFPIWNHYIGFQPTDQIQNYPSDDETSPHIKDPEQREQWKSNFFAMIYPECRFLVPKILYICLKALYFNQGYCLQDSIRTLTYIFMTMPIKRISEMYQSGKNFENDDAISEIQLPSSVSSVEDLVLEIFRRIFKILGIKNRHYQDLIDKGQSVIQPSSIVHDLSFLAIHIAMSANSMPKLRVRLFHAFLVIILQTPWNPAVFSKFPDVLIWLLRGPRCESTDLSESDTALHALQKFWPLFLRLYTELKTGKSITREGNVDSRLVPLLNILQAFFVVFVPSRVEEVRANFITPALDILLDLCETSLGSGGECAPSINLAKYASECLGVLLYRLLTISMDFNGVDFFNSAEYTTNSLWTPFVGYQKAKNLVKWSWPTKKTFFVAKCIIKVFFVPLMRKLAGVTDELSAYVKDKDLKRIRVPHITIHSQQPGITNQRLYLISLISWIWNICISIFEGLKPRDITHEGVNYAKEICSELELLRYGNVACPESSFDFRDFNLDLNFFDFPPYQDESTLRDQIFRYGLRFLDALAGLSMKFDAHTINLPDPTNVQCTIERILDMKQLNLLVKIIVYAGFNYVEYTDDEAYEFNTHPQIPIRTYCLGFYRDYIEPENNLCGKIGPSSELLSALSREEKSSLECGGGGGIYGVSYLPIVWLMCAKRQHFNFIRRAIGLNAAWPGTKALSLITNPRLPANQELNRLIESSLRLALNCNNMDVEEFAVNVYYLTVNEMPGVRFYFFTCLW
ncbi:unnamed protein product [Hymenolepis diminuta]|uniref:BLM10_mid domain-containing protein n=1 Tax=Hymenolepis diminuta TaxID=6216 RepID=A0A0R3SL62_HYMDI|nr:unnamed protein product [Hymenolepis diminuta]